MLLRRLRRFVDVREHERRVVGLAVVVLFAMVSGHMLLETARDALFLGRLDAARLPLVYAALAVLAVFAIAASDKVVAWAGQRNALITTLVFSIYGTVIFYLLPVSGPAVFALYLWSGLIGSVVVIQFWIFVGQIFTVDQGKRLFGFLAAGGALGALVGAGGAAIAVRFFPLKVLLLLGSSMFLVAAAVLTAFPVRNTGDVSSAATKSSEKKIPLSSMLRRYPYLTRLGGLIVIATITVLVVDFMFKQSAAERLPAADLGGFFATYYAIFAGASLLFQLVGANFLLRRIGVLASLAIMPLLLLVGGVATVVLGGALIATSATKGVDGALRHSLHRVSTELLWMPLPAAIRRTAKGILDSGLSRGVQAATAGGLLLLTSFELDSAPILGCIIAGLTVLWLLVAFGLRRPYLDLYRSGLSRAQSSALVDLNLKSLEVLVEALSSADDREVIAAMKLLAAKERARLIPSLILYHSSETVLTEALTLVATEDREDWIPIALKLLDSGSDRVRAGALRALARCGRLPDLANRTADISLRVRGQALFWRVQAADIEDALKEPLVVELLAARGHDNSAVAELLTSIASDGDGRWANVVLACLEDDDVQLAQLAVGATRALRDSRFILILIARLAHRRGRASVCEALLAIGPEALTALDRAFRDPHTDPAARPYLPRAIALFGSEAAAYLLAEQLDRERDGGVRFRIISALARLVVDLGSSIRRKLPIEPIYSQIERDVGEYFRLLALSAPLERQTYEMPSEAVESAGLLHGLIDDKKRQSLQRCFLLLQISHPREDVASIAAAISSGDARLRANALEFVDNMMIRFRRLEGGPQLRSLLALAFDDLSTAAKLRRAGDAGNGVPTTYDQSILELARESDETTAAIAVYHALLLDVEHLRVALAEAVAQRPLVDPLGAELHERLTNKAASA